MAGLVPAIHVLKFSQDVDARDIGTKQSFVASPGHDGQRASAFSNSEASSFETHRLTMLLRMRSQNVMVRSAKRISNHEVRYAAKQRPNWSTLEWI